MKPARCTLVALATVGLGSACNSLLDNTPGVLSSDEPAMDAGDPVEKDASMPSDARAPVDASPSSPPVDASSITDASTCNPAQKSCDGTCVTIADPRYGCASTGCTPCVAARATSVCLAGKCAIGSCDPGYADCNKVASDGCETSLSSASSCGSCNGTCGAAAPNCAPVGGTFQCTTGCSADAPLLCGKQCTDPLTSAAHCGSCNVACPVPAHGKASCTGGVCGFSCDALFHACPNGTCGGDTDTATCGPTCVACPVVVGAVSACQAGHCAFTCSPGMADCDGVAATGCEAVLASDPKNCGACGIVCATTCKKGKCDPPIDAGSSDASPSDAG